MCATIAFGMGMDTMGISFVIHWDAPHSLQEYWQQVGRGGRDGSLCLCVTMFHDKYLQRVFKQARKPSALSEARRDQRSLEVKEVSNPLQHA
jgi:ATP-dependent DNA helicase RecQ